MFFITDVLEDVKLSESHVYTGVNKNGETVKADTSVTSIINDTKGYTNEIINASSGISIAVHSKLAQILQKISDNNKKLWKDTYLNGYALFSRLSSSLIGEMDKIRGENILVYRLLNQVSSVLHSGYSTSEGYITFITEKSLINEFLFHNEDSNISEYQFLKKDNKNLIKGKALIGGTPDLIILEQNNEEGIEVFNSPRGRYCRYTIVDFKNVTQEKFSCWQMQLHIYKEMFDSYLRKRGISCYCRGLYVCNSTEDSAKNVEAHGSAEENILNKKFRDLYLSKYRTLDLEELGEISDDVSEIIALSSEIKNIEKSQKESLTEKKHNLKEKINLIREKIKKIEDTELPYRFKCDNFVMIKSGKYRTAVDIEEASLIPRLKKTAFKGYTNRVATSLGSFSFDDEDADDCGECANKNSWIDNI